MTIMLQNGEPAVANVNKQLDNVQIATKRRCLLITVKSKLTFRNNEICDISLRTFVRW